MVIFETLKKAFAAERKHDYSNLKGKKFYFADFMKCQIQTLFESNSISDEKKNNELKKLQDLFFNYEHLSIPLRQNCIDEGELLINDLKLPDIVKKKPKSKLDETKLSGIAVQYVKGIGPKTAEKFASAGILTVEDLIKYYPRKHLNYANCTKIKNAKIGENATIFGYIRKVDCFTTPGNRNLTVVNITINDNTGNMVLCWFYRGSNKWMILQYKKKFIVGAQIVVSGTVRLNKYSKKAGMDKPEIEVLTDGEEDKIGSLVIGKIVPVYPLTEGLDIKVLRKAIHTALENYKHLIIEYMPDYIRTKYNLFNLQKALSEFHFPTDFDCLQQARSRLVFDELFFVQLGLFYRRKQRESIDQGLNMEVKGELVNNFLATLPFSLTNAQDKVFKEIITDLQSDKPMNRLIQGDVGSGKTVVAFMALLAVIEKGYQGALMVPTEILAEQHYNKAVQWLTTLNVSVDLITGSQGKKSRQESLQKLASGETQLVVGTHALIQDGVEFNRLGMVIIDEQHRFGVKQRSLLHAKGQNPAVVTMTATPIPRTLALTLHGDIDISIIDEMPPNRQPIETQICGRKKGVVWDFVTDIVNKGQQVYIIYPLIEESETLDLQAATAEYENLKDMFPTFRIGLLHGKMSGIEKDMIMREFVHNNLDILVSTTVIEVGVDVPNATVMIIENAERFGLAQLHQLRGRVGRGCEKSYCFLLSDKASALVNQRLNILTQTNDGFVIAEQDLNLRGPGEFLGTRQSGIPDLLLTDIVADTVILEHAREAAKEVIDKDAKLSLPIHKPVKNELYKTFANNLEFLEA